MKFLSDILAKAGLTVDGVVTLNNTATGQTPNANDNSTKLATTAWVRTFVQPYSLPIATSSVLGGIKVGTGLSIDAGTGVLSVSGGGSASIKSTQTFTATAGQTVFTISGGYSVGLIDVFLNGVYLSPNQTTATNGSTITLGDAALAGDIIDVIIASPVYQGATTTTDQLSEGSTNLYFTNARARAAISESVTGLDYNSATGVLSITTGYGIPTTASQTTWDAAYNDKINSAAVTGTTTKTLTLTQQDGGTITASWTDDNTDAVTSVFGRTGAVVAVSGDYTTAQVTEVTNLYYTDARARAAISVTGSGSYNSATGVITVTGGVTSVNTLTGAVTLTTTNIGEGTNLYYTTARANSDFDTRLATKSTTNLAEGTNLYYTTARANSDFDTRLATKSTTNLAEGTNLYYTDTRVGTYLTGNSYATQSYVSTQINNLVSGAPGLLDTLDELAAALGDDPNFATTVSTALSNRLRIDINNQGLTSTQQGNGRTNLGLGSLAVLSSVGNAQITDLAYSKLTGVPSTFAPSAHTHPISDITGLQTALDGKQASLSGTGFVKISGSTISYDNSTYLTTSSAASTYLPLVGGTMTGQILFLSTSAPFSFQNNGNTGTYTQTTIYANQNNTSGNTANGIFIERGFTDTSNTEVRQFVIGSRGGGIQWRLDGTGNVFQSGSITANNFYSPSSTGFWSDSYDVRRNGFYADGTNLIFRAGTSSTGEQTRLSISQSTGAATFSSTLQATNIGIGNAPTGTKLFANQTSDGDWIATFKNYGGSASYGVSIDMSNSTSDQSALQVYTRAGNGIRVTAIGNLLVGTFTDIGGNLVVKRPYSSGYSTAYIGNTSFTAWNRQTYDTFVLQQDDVTSFRMVEKNGETTASDQVLTFAVGDGYARIASSAQPLEFFVNGSPSAFAYTGLGGTKVLRLNTNGNAEFNYALSISGTVTAGQYRIAPNGTSAVYNIVDATNTFAGTYNLQAGGGSAGYGGSLVMYGHSHASRPGYVSAGISTGSGGKFTVMSGGNTSGSDVFTVDASGAGVFNSSVTIGSIVALTPSGFGYDPNGYKVLIVGQTGDLIYKSIAFGVNVSGNPSGAFSGWGNEYIWRNTGSFITPNSANNGYNTLFGWNSSGSISFGTSLNGLSVSGTINGTGGAVHPLAISSSQRYILQVRNTSNTVDSGYGWWWFMDTNFNMGFHADGASDRFTLTRDGNLSVSGTLSAAGYNKSNWDTAYGWGNPSGVYLPLSGGTMAGDITISGNRVKDLSSTNRGVFIGNWGGAGYWGLGSTSNAHELKLDQVSSTTGFWEGATDVNLYLGSNRLVLHSGNISSYALTSYTETDTLSTVVSRGNSTSSAIRIKRPTNKVDNSGATEFGGRVEYNNTFNAGASGYTIFYYPSDYVFRILADYDGNIGGAQPHFQIGYAYLHVNSRGTNIGFVGIGNETPAYRLDVSGDIRTSSNLYVVNDRNYYAKGSLRLTSSSNNASTLDISVTDSTTTIYSNYYSGGSDNTIIIGTYANLSNQLVLKNNGNIGINTTNPTTKLWVQQGIGTFACNTTGDSVINTSTSSSLLLGPKGSRAGTGLYMAGISFDHLLNYGAVGDTSYSGIPHAWIGIRTVDLPGWERSALVFATRQDVNGTAGTTIERACITPYGQLLIGAQSSGYGTYNYGYNLGVKGNSSQVYMSLSLSGQTLDTQGLIVGIDTTAARFHVRDNKGIMFANNDTEKVLINTSGSIIASGDITAYGSPSDARLKTIKEIVPNALDKVMKLTGYRFDWNEVSDLAKIKEDVGVIAQEVEKVLPELARTNEDGFMSVRYQGLTAVLIEAIKEQQTQIESQKSEIDELKGLVQQLINR